MTINKTEGRAGFGLPPGVWRPITGVLAFCLILIAVCWSLNLPRSFGMAFYPQQFLAAVLALALPMAFLMLPAQRGAERVVAPWYDCLFALLSLLAVGYVAVGYPQIVNFIFSKPPSAYVPGLIAIPLLLEALRRTTGLSLVIIIGVFLLYALFGDLVPGRLAGRPQDWQMLSGYMAFDVNGIFGIPMAVAATVVVTFILFGSVLGVSGGSRFFTDASLLVMGRFRGGSMKIAVLASALFGSVSGSAVANVTATGIVTIPMIKRDGYPGHKAGAIEAVASTGGQLMPPVMGAAAFLMAEFLQVSYAEIALAALVPSLLYYVALFIQADLEAARLGISRLAESDVPEGRTVLTGVHFLLAFVVLIGALFGLRWQPERAALAAALSVVITSLVFGYQSARPKIGTLFSAIVETGRSVVEIIIISAAAGLVIGVLNVTGLSFNLTYLLVQIGGGNTIVLLTLSAIICIVLGMGLPTLGVYVLLAALVAPAMVQVGIEPIAAHLFVLYFGMMSMITPPIAIAAFAAASIAKAPAMQTGLASVKFGWVAFIVPFLFVYSPSMLLLGDMSDVVLAVITAVVGVWLVSAALAGYAVGRLSLAMRVLFGFFGLMALIPAGMFPGATYTDMVGVAGGAALLAIEAYRKREQQKKALS